MLDINITTAAIETAAANTTTENVTSYYGTAGADAGNVRYDPFAPGQVSAAQGLGDIETIKPRSRDQYVALFKKTEERTARATLQMCRVVYEAHQSLEEYDFADFCAAVGYKDDSSVIRKFCAIGKLQPRLVNHAAFMPPEWTKIYMLTQMPAQFFESYVNDGMDFRGLTGKQLKALVDATRPQVKQLSLLLPKDKDSNNFVFAKLLFDKTFVDAYDWRAVKKALAEIESRLPIKVQFVAAAEQAYQNTVKHRYTQARENAKDVEFKPALWDYGTEAAQDNLKADVAQLRTVEGTVTPIVAVTE
jgi:hypothetical protein